MIVMPMVVDVLLREDQVMVRHTVILFLLGMVLLGLNKLIYQLQVQLVIMKQLESVLVHLMFLYLVERSILVLEMTIWQHQLHLCIMTLLHPLHLED